jgi:hypothetical protein
MPRIIIILFSLFFTHLGNSQLSISAGFAKRVEGGWNKEDYRKFVHFDYKDRFWNDYFLLTTAYQKKSILFSSEFSFFTKNLPLYAYSSEIDIWNHGETSISDYTYRSAQIKYSYAGVNLGIHKVLFNEKIYNLILGANLHTEFLVHENEYNHKDSSSSVYRGNGYNFQTQTKYSFTYLTTYPINYTAFDALNLRKLTTSVGFSLKNRFNFNPLFLELNFQLGIMTKQRTFLNYSNHEAEAFADHKFVVRPYSEIGLKIGYKFPTKTN